jgi:hypothetical protein
MGLPATSARAGALGDFQGGLGSSSSGSGGGHSSGGDDFFFLWMFQELFLNGIVVGGAGSMTRLEEEGGYLEDLEIPPRQPGEALIPFVRLDATYQAVESDVAAADYSTDLGYGAFAVRFNQTRYWEQHPSDELDLYRIYGLYRMSFGSQFEIDMGFGTMIVDGTNRTDRFSFTLPILYHPHPSFGIECRPAWSDDIMETALGVLVGARFVSIKAGYRWLRSSEQSLNGPYIGLSLRY